MIGKNINIGLSLIPFSEKECIEIINMAHSLQIHNFEIPFGNSEYLARLVRTEIFSVHAAKDILEKDYEAFCIEIQYLKEFCEKCSCKRIVFHPNPNYESNEMYFSILKMQFPDYRICIEDTNKNFDELIPLLSKYHFYITWDSAHAVYYNHYIWNKMERIEYFHIRGFSENKRYVSLTKTEKSVIIPKKLNTVYILEYPDSVTLL